MKFLAAIPLLFSIVGCVLVALATFAGRKPGFMEDYAVVRVRLVAISCPSPGQALLTLVSS